jgi:PHP domain
LIPKSPRTLPALLAAGVITGCDRAPEVSFVTAVPWGLTGRSVVVDTHTHTRFSDGALLPGELAARAAMMGCDALAITDHGDLRTRAATPEYFAEIARARESVPGLILFAGIEWNIPPYKQREHVTVLVDPALERSLLPLFKERFERDSAQAEDGLKWLAQHAKQREEIVLVYNHPSRQDQDSQENVRDFLAWSKASDLRLLFEGGPGHQKAGSPGAYQGKFRTEARWDPVVAEIGGTWDHLLDQGHQVWGALAVSDYHNDQMDYVPCQFSRTTLRVPHKDHRGILLALRAGSFWAGHGRVLDDLQFLAANERLPLPATSGEVIRLSSDARVVFRLKITRGPAGKGQPLRAEIIGNGVNGKIARVAVRDLGPHEDVFDWYPERLIPGGDGRTAYFRVRVIAPDSNNGPLVAYGNPIRIELKR